MFASILRNAVCILAAAGLATGIAAARQDQQKKNAAPAQSPAGAELYKQNCAVCHGDDLRGGTGDFPTPYRRPPDLTTLAKRRGGKFPDAYVSDVLRNGVALPAHGPAEMPVWGMEFKAGNRLTAGEVNSRIALLVAYIKLHQSK